MRHGKLRKYDPGVGVSIATLAYEYPAGYEVPEHAHGSHQLIHATGESWKSLVVRTSG